MGQDSFKDTYHDLLHNAINMKYHLVNFLNVMNLAYIVESAQSSRTAQQ